MYHGRTPPDEPPCETCREVPREEDKDALNIFFLVRDQLIMSMNGPISVNQLAIHKVMEHFPHKIENYFECFEKVLTLSRWWIGEITNKGE